MRKIWYHPVLNAVFATEKIGVNLFVCSRTWSDISPCYLDKVLRQCVCVGRW